jgi:uncharacterized protein YqjF (DUF2071 family)
LSAVKLAGLYPKVKAARHQATAHGVRRWGGAPPDAGGFTFFVRGKAVRELLTAEWRHLLFQSYPVDPRVLEPFLPAGTEIDAWDGRAWLSVVAYQFRSVKLWNVPVPGHQHFEGLNLRFCVKRRAGGQERRGVTFLSEIAPRPAMALMTRLMFNEPYAARDMRSVIDAGPPLRVAYSWRADASWQHCTAVAAGPAAIPQPSTLEGFLVERHFSYTRQPDGTTLEYRVDHSPWRVFATASRHSVTDYTALYGPEIGSLLTQPASELIAEGSPVRMYWPQRLDAAGDAPEPWRNPATNRAHRRV